MPDGRKPAEEVFRIREEGEDDAASQVEEIQDSRRSLRGDCRGSRMGPHLTRVLFVLISVLSAAFPGIIVYILLWVLMPQADV
jgi:hypothetical protein